MIIKIFLFWRIGLFIITFLGSLALPKIDNGALGSVGPGKEFNYWASWAQWDGGHYHQIARQGYMFLSDYAFFPLYPILIRLSKPLFFGDILITGLIIANISFFLFLYIFYHYLKNKFGQKTTVSTISTFLTFPTAFFAVAYYSESIFLLLAITAFYFLNKKRFLLASLAVSFASLTRLVGASLIISVVYCYLSTVNLNLKKLDRNLLHVSVAAFGFAAYVIFLFAKLNDPFKFLTSQISWERSITDPISTIISYFWAIATGEFRPVNDYFDLSLTVLFLTVLILGIKKIPSSMWIFSMLVILIPSSTGTLTSMPRYLLSSLGAFIVIGKFLEGKPRLKIAVWSISLIVQSILAVRFINGHWVA